MRLKIFILEKYQKQALITFGGSEIDYFCVSIRNFFLCGKPFLGRNFFAWLTQVGPLSPLSKNCFAIKVAYLNKKWG